ncbi:MBL fold metallo-hydrolase [Aldersonia sp. NBC_00410]|uniref:MBL fold metallo-hydrolase n=1 Tax=Aldersonia sp. NBC_00410 TaxID=2975954 RepID=UPI002257A136|nr:MBL fold metallo-hydrolase [Aldersonia sp. NBC_00410]MCX5046668.1 MBL fold metallo-hydrolase [Aldersonia sp. NBC_00410]
MSSTLTFIGQQSWLLQSAGATVLVDPVLTDSFGNSERLRFEIYPPRSVDLARIPRLDAVVVTNEHLDHLHLPSLRLLGNRAPVILPASTPTVCVDAVEAIGTDVVLLKPNENYAIGEGHLRFLAGAGTVPVWESRVHSVWLGPAGLDRDGVLIQSDTELGDAVAHLRPDALVVTHNAQIPPAGHLGAFDNLLPIPSGYGHRTTGLEILRQLLADSTSRVSGTRYILFSGGGYTQNPPKHGRFLWDDYKELADAANTLSIEGTVIGLRPGESFTTGPQSGCGTADWITARTLAAPPTASDKDDTAEPDLAEDFSPLFAPEEGDSELIDRELHQAAPHLMLSALGRGLIEVSEYLGNPTGAHRFAIHLRGDTERLVALNFNTARFEDIEGGLRDALFAIPSGIDVWACDLAAVLCGKIHIWELAVSRMRQWYVGDATASPVAFLYGYLSEQLRPDLARQLYREDTAG